MRHDLPEIVEAFTREKLNVRLQTAGTHFATEDKLRACYEAGARDINVSVDSLDHNTFDYINGVPGSSQNAFKTIELISTLFRKKSAILSFGTVLSRFNYLEIPAILEFAKRIGWHVSLVPIILINAAIEVPM
jgi:MoaA/NifB/PqqE/SkfB family radical SAM enzyme